MQMGEDAHLFIFGGLLSDAKAANRVIGVAVSGGSDSVALLHLLAIAAPHLRLSLCAATVDHDLRQGSAQEAAEVARMCHGLGIPHETLLWQHGAVVGNLQDQARRARYGLLADWAQRRGIGQVLLAHTADDQAETFLMGLAREAGLDGLTGMRPSWMQAGVRFSRPLLAKTRADLRHFLTKRGLRWIDDPSNDNDRFARVKARKVLQALRPLGVSVENLAATVGNLAAAQRGLIAAVADSWSRIGHETAGSLQMSLQDLHTQSSEITRRLLLAAIEWLSGGDYPPRAHKIDTLAVALLQGRDATLGGCRFRIKDARLTILREPRAVAGLESPTDQLWDNRWHLSGPDAPGLTIRALGVEGLAACKDWRSLGIARDALLVTPAIWRGPTLIAAPLAGFSNDWCANCSPSFASFILSH
ncbi:MAG: tRNA lysidine(34) synthetase TilS [Pseudorhodobacter sp. PARRP1]|nr:MAG: tRNA lysidine(34) synthetase TilS [Pseudorhodobacter sp. PARRP1]